MRRTGKMLLVGVVALSFGVAGTVYAYAGGWTVTSAGTQFTAKVVTMPRGAEPRVAEQGDQAVVSWSAQEIAPGVRMDHYVVTAHSVADPPRPDVAHTVAAAGGSTESITFGTAEVAGGAWRWTVAPKYRQWIGAESPLSRRLVFDSAPDAPAAPADAAVAAVPSAATPASTAAATGETPRSPAPAVRTSPPGRTTNEPANEPAGTPVESGTPADPDPVSPPASAAPETSVPTAP